MLGKRIKVYRFVGKCAALQYRDTQNMGDLTADTFSNPNIVGQENENVKMNIINNSKSCHYKLQVNM